MWWYIYLPFRFRSLTDVLTISTSLTPWSRVLLENPIASHIVRKFSMYDGTRRFITVFTTARHSSLSVRSRPTLILFPQPRLVLPSDLFPSGFPSKTLYVPLLSVTHAT